MNQFKVCHTVRRTFRTRDVYQETIKLTKCYQKPTYWTIKCQIDLIIYTSTLKFPSPPEQTHSSEIRELACGVRVELLWSSPKEFFCSCKGRSLRNHQVHNVCRTACKISRQGCAICFHTSTFQVPLNLVFHALNHSLQLEDRHFISYHA